MSMTRSFGNWIRGTAVMVPVYIGIILTFFATLVRTWTDFKTSWIGVQGLGQASMGSPIEDALSTFALAILPQALSLVMVYVFISIDLTGGRRNMIGGLFAATVAATMIALDVYTGYVFYETGSNPLFFSLVADTLFSEFGLSFSFALLIELRKDFSRQVASIFSGIGHRESRSVRQNETVTQQGNNPFDYERKRK